MAEIQKINGRSQINYMARDYDSLLQAMRDQIPAKLPEWTDYTSEADFGNVLLELFAHMGDILSYYQDRIANESFLTTAQTRRSVIQHLRLIGYRLTTASPAAANLELTVPASFIGTVILKRGDAFTTKSQPNRQSLRFEYTSSTPLEIDFAKVASSPDPKNPQKSIKVYEPGIPVEEGRLIQDEILGIASDKPNQRFTLSHSGAIVRSFNSLQQNTTDIQVKIQTITTAANGTVTVSASNPWNLRETLAFSRESQEDFTLEIDDQDRVTILFGDSAFGAIPPMGSRIVATYRVGGGTAGNVAARTIETIADCPALTLAGASVSNSLPASGGADRESIEHAVLHAPKVFRSLKRAVTVDDYKALALNFNGVSKVRAEASSWNIVKLYIAPQGGGRVSDVLTKNLLAYFEDKRPLTTLIEIANVDYVKLYISAKVGVESYYSRNEVGGQVRAAIANLLALENVDFKQTFYLSKFYEAIEAIAGVAYVTITQFRRQNQPPDTIEQNGMIALGSNELPVDPVTAGDPKLITLTIEGGG